MREKLFVVGPGHSRIALLSLAQEAFFGGQQSALAVDVDGTTFEHDGIFPEDGLDCTGIRGLGHEAANFFVVTIVGVFGPGIEAPGDGNEIFWG